MWPIALSGCNTILGSGTVYINVAGQQGSQAIENNGAVEPSATVKQQGRAYCNRVRPEERWVVDGEGGGGGSGGTGKGRRGGDKRMPRGEMNARCMHRLLLCL